MSDKINLKTWVEKFQAGDFNSRDVNVQIEAGWFDWFCKDEALAARTQKFGKRLVDIVNITPNDTTKVYVFFKNCLPLIGKMYDRVSIADIESEDPLVVLEHRNGAWYVYHKADNFTQCQLCGSWAMVKKYFTT